MLSGQDVLGAGLPGWMVAGRALHSSEAAGWSSWFGSAAECILCSGDATGWAPPLSRQGLRLCPCVPWQGGAIGLIPQFARITRSCSAIAPVWVGPAWMVSLHVEVGLQAGLSNQVGIGCAHYCMRLLIGLSHLARTSVDPTVGWGWVLCSVVMWNCCLQLWSREPQALFRNWAGSHAGISDKPYVCSVIVWVICAPWLGMAIGFSLWLLRATVWSIWLCGARGCAQQVGQGRTFLK